MRIRPFRPTDIVAIEQQASQRGVLGIYEPQVSLRHGYELEAMGPAYTAEIAGGRVLAVAGLGEVFLDRQATAWAIFAEGWWAAVDRRAVVRALRAGLQTAPFARIEVLARMARPAEIRFLEFIGFTRRAVLEQWGPRSEAVMLLDRLGPVPVQEND